MEYNHVSSTNVSAPPKSETPLDLGMDGEPSGPGSSTEANLKNEQLAVPLLVRNISAHISERDVKALFEQVGPVAGLQIVPPVYMQTQPSRSMSAIVQYFRQASAEAALSYLQGFLLAGLPLVLDWASGGDAGPKQPSGHALPAGNSLMAPDSTQTQREILRSAPSEQKSYLYSVFVGDLDMEIDDTILAQTFCAFPSFYDARVIRDLRTGQSRGYGFVRFRSERDAMEAIASMSGQWVGSRIIRVNWAIRPAEPYPTEQRGSVDSIHKGNDYVSDSKTLYVGNLPFHVNLPHIMNIFASFGNVINAQMFPGRRYAFVTFQFATEAHKAWEISQSNPPTVAGHVLKVGWARFTSRNLNPRK